MKRLALLACGPAVAADATSYAEAEAGNFTISGTNAIAAKVAACEPAAPAGRKYLF